MPENKSKHPLVALTAGCIAGGIEATAVWPMESIKTQLQLQVKGAKPPPFNGVLSGLSYTVRNHGVGALYRGLAPTLIGSIPKAGIRFGGNQFFRNMLGGKEGKLSPLKNFTAGLLAGFAEAIVAVAPMETFKTKLIEKNMSMSVGLKHIMKTEGIGGFYQGVPATMMKQGSNQGLRFFWFHEYKPYVNKLQGRDGNAGLLPIEALLGGMTAGCFSTLGNNPFDVIKTRMQASNAKERYPGGTLQCARRMLLQEGVASFYTGIVPRLARVIPGQGIIFMCFEGITEVIDKTMRGNGIIA